MGTDKTIFAVVVLPEVIACACADFHRVFFTIVVVQNVGTLDQRSLGALSQTDFSPFFGFPALFSRTFFNFFFFHSTCLTNNKTKFCTMVVASTGFSFSAILFSLSASYNLIIFYELAHSLVICPFAAILFS
jgi:hypothetical protein